ncbi:MAG: recombinase family protein [Sphingopyxis sp.]|uniref:recombinase family protein n=1 Tax=Sphingopyxis sp. TaxID=1908224 RepID=UPI0032EABF2E
MKNIESKEIEMVKSKVAPKAFGYVRVSVDEEDGNNASIASQKAAIEAYAEKEEIELLEIFEEPRGLRPQTCPQAVRQDDRSRHRVRAPGSGCHRV